jgi:hypothetical protein
MCAEAPTWVSGIPIKMPAPERSQAASCSGVIERKQWGRYGVTAQACVHATRTRMLIEPFEYRTDAKAVLAASVQRVTLDHARVVGSLDDLEAEH